MSNDEQQISSVKWVWFGILAGIVVLFGASSYFILPSLISKTKNDVKVIKGLRVPVKIKPAAPGGKTVNHQDLMVVDILKGGTQSDDHTETLRPNSSKPEPPPINVAKNTTTETVPNSDKTGELINIQGNNTATQQDDTLANRKKQDNSIISTNSKVKKNEPSNAVEKKSLKNKLTGEGAAKITSSKSGERLVVIEGEIPSYMIQLAAFRSAEKAIEIAKILSQKHKSRLNGINLETMQVNTGSNGVFHRVVSAPLPRVGADKMCSTLRRSGQDCFIRKYIRKSP